MLAFGGTRTYHRMACAIEDAGFEIRDSLHWIYGSGFPKSLDISKALDKMAGAEREVIGPSRHHSPGRKATNTLRSMNVLYRGEDDGKYDTAPATPAAKQWAGWGSALKPAHEPIVLARKPLACKTIAENVLEWGCGGLNIDSCRISTTGIDQEKHLKEWDRLQSKGAKGNVSGGMGLNEVDLSSYAKSGRFPSNLIWSHSPLCKQIGETWDCHPSCPTWAFKKAGERQSRPGKTKTASQDAKSIFAGTGFDSKTFYPGDTGSASRFFKSCSYTSDDMDIAAAISPFYYCSKASRAEREKGLDGMPDKAIAGCYGEFEGDGRGRQTEHRPAKNNHPTIKPVQLISYLARLICPPGGTILDPFGGSGTLAVAAIREGFHYVLIEKEAEYIEIARSRAAHELKQRPSSIPSTIQTFSM